RRSRSRVHRHRRRLGAAELDRRAPRARPPSASPPSLPVTSPAMGDVQIHDTIERLVAEEHELWQREAAGDAGEADRQRLEGIKVSLDQCWDLLRQRRALREAGLDPETAAARGADVVEQYE